MIFNYNILSSEEKLLLSLCRLQFTNKEIAGINLLLNGNIDWGKFVDLANKHGIIALCFHNFKETGILGSVPESARNTLHSGFIKSLTRNTFIYGLLKEVLNVASACNIKVILLKGAALEKTLYGDKGLRQMTDIDILVRKEDAIVLRNALIKSGFETTPTVSRIHEKMLLPLWKHLNELNKNGLSVEIHFNLFNEKEGIYTNRFVKNAEPFGIDGQNAYLLRPEDHFLYLVKHLCTHEESGSTQLRLYNDLSFSLLYFQDKDLGPEMLAMAAELNLREKLLEKVKICELFFELENRFLSAADINLSYEILENNFIKSLRRPSSETNGLNEIKLIPALREISSIKERILFLAGFIFPSIIYMQYRYKLKSKLSCIFFYPYRWIEGFWNLLTNKYS
jgi:hypothetical protein